MRELLVRTPFLYSTAMKRIWRQTMPLRTLLRPRDAVMALIYGVVLLGSLPAAAQVSHLSSWIGGNFPYSQWARPTVADGGRLNCAPGNDNCVPLNLAACQDSAPARPIAFSVNPPAGGQHPAFSGSNQIVYAFLSTSASCVYSQQIGGQNNNPNFLIGTSSGVPSSSVFFGGNVPFKLGDSSGALTLNTSLTGFVPGEITTKDVLKAFNVCPNLGGTAAQLQTYYICIGLDADATSGINNTAAASSSTSTTTAVSGSAASTGTDPFQYIQFQIDTMPPEQPNTLSLNPLNGRVDVAVTFSSADLDVQVIRILATDDEVNLPSGDPNAADEASDCTLWTGDVKVSETSVQGLSTGDVAYTFHATNGKIVQACAVAVDYLGNQSLPTPIQTAVPRAECDLFTCYPGELTTGFCNAGLSTPYWGVAAGAALLRSVSARRRRTSRLKKGGSR